MPLNAGIILQGQNPNLVNALAQGTQAAQLANNAQRENALANLYQTQGAGIAAGDQNALNALAAHDPQAALGVQEIHLGMDATRQGMRQSEERLQMLRDEAARKAQTHAASLSAAERAAQAATIERGLSTLAPFYSRGDREGYNRALQSLGLDPNQYAFEDFEGNAAQFEGVLDVLTTFDDRNEGPEPADEYGRYAAEERAAGRQPLDRIQYAQAKKGKGFSVTTPDGTVVQYGGSGDNGGRADPSSPDAMIDTINGILNDPALDTATGMLSPLQNIPGTGARRFASRARQLEGQAFLQAFESLKGAGQITEIEGLKATQAIGRLDTGQSADDYREALTELRTILEAARGRPAGWVDTQGGQQPSGAPAAGAIEDGYRFLGGDPSNQSNWEKVQ